MSRHPTPRRPARIVPMARPGGPPRLVVELAPADQRAYDRAVSRLTPRIERSLGPAVVANRARGRGGLMTVELEPWLPARQRWARAVRRAAHVGAWFVRADVARFYESLREPALRRALPSGVDDVLMVLRTLWDDGVSGLPVGPEASAIMANAALASVDQAIKRAGGMPLRWVDDWVIPVPSRDVADRVLTALEEGLLELGLRLNPAKTRVLAPADTDRILTRRGCAVSGGGRGMMPAP